MMILLSAKNICQAHICGFRACVAKKKRFQSLNRHLYTAQLQYKVGVFTAVIVQKRTFTRFYGGNIGLGIGLHNANLNRIITTAHIEDLGLQDSLTYDIVQCDNTKALLDFVPQFLQRNPEGCHMARFISHLIKLHYSIKLESLPWLHTNVHIAYIQLLLNKKLDETMHDVTSHPNFSILCDTIGAHVTELTDHDLTDCMLSLLYLNIDHTHPIIHYMLRACRQQVQDFNMTALSSLCNITRCLNGIDAITIPKILQRLQNIMADSEYEWTVDDVLAYSLAVNQIQRFSSDTLIDKFITHIEKLQLNKQNLHDPECLGAMVRTIQTLFVMGPNKAKIPARQLLDPAIAACFETIDRFEAPNIAEVCHALKKSRCYERDISSVMEKRIGQLLVRDGDTLKIRDISNIMYGLTRHTPEDIQLTVDNLLYKRLLTQPVDIVVLSNLAESLYMLHVRSDILELFQQRVAENADGLIAYVSRYKKIMKLLSRHKFINKQHEQQFTDVLLKDLDRQHGLSMSTVAPIAQFLVPNSYYALPDQLIDKLIVAIPKWREAELYRVSVTGLQ